MRGGALAYRGQDGWADDPRTAELRHRIEELEWELETFRAERSLDELVPLHIRAPRQTLKLIGVFSRRGGRVLQREFVIEMVRLRNDINDYAQGPKYADVLLCKARRVLGALGLEIRTLWGVGFFMPPEDAARWLDWCWRRAAGEAPPADYPLKTEMRFR